MRKFLFLLLAVSWLLACPAVADPTSVHSVWETNDYVKTEVVIPMRDGAGLYTAIYRPSNREESSPILLTRTPYSCAPYGPTQFPEAIYPDPILVEEGYTLVCQDVRGTHRSDGNWIHMRPHRGLKLDGENEKAVDESTDAWDTIDWLIRNVPGNSGRVCLWGASYPGFFVAASMIDPHPALVCALPQAPQSDWWFEDVHHNGAFFLAPVVEFLLDFGGQRPGPSDQDPKIDFILPMRDGYRFFLDEIGPLSRLDERVFRGRAQLWNDIASHPNRDDFWRERDVRPRLAPIAPAVLNVGGWYDDSNLFGSFAVYRAVEARNPRSFNSLVVGPWEHTGWEWEASGDRHGDIPFGSATAQFYRLAIQKPFLDYYARGLRPSWDRGRRLDLPEAWMFEVGENRWRAFDFWPPHEAMPKDIYLNASGVLSWDPPALPSVSFVDSFDAFVSDPAHPVPFTERIVPFRDPSYMTADQRFAARRPDVLVYQGPVLTKGLTVAGPIEVDLWVSTDAADADWIVKLVDVFPDHPEESDWQPGQRASGYQMLVRGDVLRGRFRDDPRRPARFPIGEPTRVTFILPDVLHAFQPGHRLMVQIQSTWFPLVDRNPQGWVENIYRATAEDFRAATHRVYRSSRHASKLRLLVLPTGGAALSGARPIRYWNPSWSPDGEWILFESNLEGGHDFSLWAVHRERTGLYRVLSRARQGRWSPDGSQLLFVTDLGESLEISIARADGGDAREVSEDEGYANMPRWSPDGASIAYICRSAKGNRIHDLCMMSATGGGERFHLTDSSSDEVGLSFAPDGSEIAFASDRYGNLDILAVRPDGSGLRRLTVSPAMDSMPAWSPDGKTIAFASDRTGTTQIHLLDLPGANVRSLTNVTGTALMPSWSPDGRWLAFIGDDGAGWGVFKVRPDGTGLGRITPVLEPEQGKD